jgi:dimethylargininase
MLEVRFLMITAITRKPSPSLLNCELTYLERQVINVEKATQEHCAYEQCLKELGVQVVSLRPESTLPDAAFVEDIAVVVDEIAVVARMGAAKRQTEINSLIALLSYYRPLDYITAPATLEGGDVIRIGRTLYVGVSTRTNYQGVEQLQKILYPYDYQVIPVPVSGCLHLTTGCSYIGQGVILANGRWVDSSQLRGVEVIDVCSTAEPWAANTMAIDGVILVSSSFPKTMELLASRGHRVRAVEIAELEKAEAGLSCLSKLFETDKPAPQTQTA